MKKPAYNCGAKEGKTIILNSHAHVGVITEFRDMGKYHSIWAREKRRGADEQSLA